MSKKQSEEILLGLGSILQTDEDQRKKLCARIKGIIVFCIDGDRWILDLRSDKGSLSTLKESPSESPEEDLRLTMTDETFVKLVLGSLNPQQAFLMRKLKIKGSMGLAMKVESILHLAKPKAKL